MNAAIALSAVTFTRVFLSLFLSGIACLLFTIAWIVLIVWLFRKANPKRQPAAPVAPETMSPAGAANARALLDTRYAKGEISDEEYLRMKENLK
jgi:uncharacterized membrane protein